MEAPDATDRRESWVSEFELEMVDPVDRVAGPVRVLRWP
jgi:hypothetical protein